MERRLAAILAADVVGYSHLILDDEAVILAARIAAQAQGGEILISSVIRELTQSAGDLRFGTPRDADLKGIVERQRLYDVPWD